MTDVVQVPNAVIQQKRRIRYTSAGALSKTVTQAVATIWNRVSGHRHAMSRACEHWTRQNAADGTQLGAI
jgi:hypothetical protein